MPFYRFILISIAIIGVCLVCAYLLIQRRQLLLAFLFGILLIGLYQVYLHQSLHASLQACIDRACRTAGLPPNCPEAQFGCTEWSGLSVFLFYVTGLIQGAIFIVGAGILAFLAARKGKAVSQTVEPSA